MSMNNGKGKKSRATGRKAKRAQRLGVSEVAVNVTFRHMEATDALRLVCGKEICASRTDPEAPGRGAFDPGG